jgi:hypothetical protein
MTIHPGSNQNDGIMSHPNLYCTQMLFDLRLVR